MRKVVDARHDVGFDVELDERLVDTSADDLCDQLSEYEQGARRSFDADVHIPDSFTGDVMRAMLDIPYGETRTYGQIAEVVEATLSPSDRPAGETQYRWLSRVTVSSVRTRSAAFRLRVELT